MNVPELKDFFKSRKARVQFPREKKEAMVARAKQLVHDELAQRKQENDDPDSSSSLDPKPDAKPSEPPALKPSEEPPAPTAAEPAPEAAQKESRARAHAALFKPRRSSAAPAPTAVPAPTALPAPTAAPAPIAAPVGMMDDDDNDLLRAVASPAAETKRGADEHSMIKAIRHHLDLGEPIPRHMFDLATAAGMPTELATQARPFLQPDGAEAAAAVAFSARQRARDSNEALAETESERIQRSANRAEQHVAQAAFRARTAAAAGEGEYDLAGAVAAEPPPPPRVPRARPPPRAALSPSPSRPSRSRPP